MTEHAFVKEVVNSGNIVSKLEQYTPRDSRLSPGRLVFQIEDGSIPVLHSSSDKFILTDFSFNQLISRLHPRATPTFVRLFDNDTKTRIINQLLQLHKSKSNQSGLLIRRMQNADTIFSVLSSTYRPVNHSDLGKLIVSALERFQHVDNGEIHLHANYHSAFARIPGVKISSEGLGTYSGVQFKNGQDGLTQLEINSLIFEKVCTNGAVRTSDKHTFIHRKHTGNADIKIEEFPDWFVNTTKWNTQFYNKARKLTISNPSKFVNEVLSKEYGITAGLSMKILDYVQKFDKQITAWSVMRALTELGQNSKDRFSLDEKATEIVEDLIRIDLDSRGN